MSYTAAVITVSDKGYRGERTDTSGPNLVRLLEERGYNVAYTCIVPDEKEAITGQLLKCSDRLGISLILTTGGTGFSPRDITPEATLEVVERLTTGIPEAMRAESMKITPKGCLSRGVAGIRGRSLIINLPGSKKASQENLLAVLAPVEHGLEMLLGEGSANCGENLKKEIPSMDSWLKEAKAHESAPKVGMYLTHNGVVRQTAKAQVRDGQTDTKPVSGMDFSFDQKKVDAAISDTYRLEGIYHVRVWLNEGRLNVGDNIMFVLVGGDIRPNVVNGLEYLVSRIKNECITETELYQEEKL